MLAALCALGCTEPAPLTQLIVVVDTDLRVPSEATEIEVTVVAPDTTTQRAARRAPRANSTRLLARCVSSRRSPGPASTSV